MRLFILGTLLSVTFLASHSLAGDVYKCVDESGKVVFSDVACPSAKKVEKQPLAPPKPTIEIQPVKQHSGYGVFIDRSRNIGKKIKEP